uniref:hypothetical protein n=1 Tax=Staphylococcus hominis TaxID=1290 RepID=UPI0016438556
LLFVNFISETAGDYVSVTIDATDAPFKDLKVSYDAAIPPGTKVTPFYSLDKGKNWVELKNPKITPQSAEFSRYEFTATNVAPANNLAKSLKFKLELRADNRFVRPRVRRFTGVFKDDI